MVGNTSSSSSSSSSVTSRKIVQSFIDFLLSVESSTVDDDDIEALEVAKDCLTQAFKLHLLPNSERPQPNLLLNLFSSSPSPSSSHIDGVITQPDSGPDASADDVSESTDQLFSYFLSALDKIHFFDATRDGDDEHVSMDRASSLFHLALDEIETTGNNLLDCKTMADALKVLGNNSMHANSYSDAIERYTCAIALDDTNAIYYSNRAAAYTQVHKYNEAITDCLKSIEIDPSYSKAYSRMGLAYFAQGKYSDAINKGYRKALELDPNNDAVKENIRVAEQKLTEEQEQRNQFQNSGYSFSGASGDGTASSSSAFGSIPANLASMFSNLAGNASQNQTGQGRSAEDNNGTPSGSVDGNTVPEGFASMFENFGMSMNMSGQSSDQGEGISVGNATFSFNDQGQGINVGNTNFSFNLGGQTPEDLTRAFSSMMGVFPGGSASQEGNPQGNTDSR